jgi:hypothetical protein
MRAGKDEHQEGSGAEPLHQHGRGFGLGLAHEGSEDGVGSAFPDQARERVREPELDVARGRERGSSLVDQKRRRSPALADESQKPAPQSSPPHRVGEDLVGKRHRVL